MYAIRSDYEMLRLHRVNHCVVIPDNEHYTGMIKKVKDYVTYGEIDKDTLVALILKRGRLPGNKRLTEELVKELTELPVEELAEKIIAGEIKIKDTPIKP